MADDASFALIRSIAADLTALDAAAEVLAARHPDDPVVVEIDQLSKRLLHSQLRLLERLKA